MSFLTIKNLSVRLKKGPPLLRRVSLLEGLAASALDEVFSQRLQLSPGAREMLKHMKAAGLRTVLVSGGFTYFTQRLQKELGLDVAHAIELEIVDGKLTGRVNSAIVDADAKQATVEAESGLVTLTRPCVSTDRRSSACRGHTVRPNTSPA